MRFPLTSKAVVDEQEFLDIVDQLRVAIPEEMRQAKRVNLEKEKVIGTAQTEAERILIAAQEQAALMLKDNEIMKTAAELSQAKVSEAEKLAEEIRAGADAYAMDVLIGLENELNRLIAQVRRGRATLEKSLAESQASLAQSANVPSHIHGEARAANPGGRSSSDSRKSPEIRDDLSLS